MEANILNIEQKFINNLVKEINNKKLQILYNRLELFGKANNAKYNCKNLIIEIQGNEEIIYLKNETDKIRIVTFIENKQITFPMQIVDKYVINYEIKYY